MAKAIGQIVSGPSLNLNVNETLLGYMNIDTKNNDHQMINIIDESSSQY